MRGFAHGPENEKKGCGKKPQPLNLLVRPARFERAAYGLEVCKMNFPDFYLILPTSTTS